MSDPFGGPEWLRYADHVREELIPKIKESTVTMALLSGTDPDPKQALETGYMVLLDKPIITVVLPGVKVPDKLVLVSDAIVEAVDDPAETARRIADAIAEVDLRMNTPTEKEKES